MSKQQNEFSQHWKQKQITERKMTERQKLLLEIERLNKEIIKLKEVIENKNAHVESKNKHIARLEKVISIMKKGEPTIFWFFPKGALSHWVQWVRFCPAKLSVTWQSRGIFLCIPFYRCTKRHYRSSDTLYNCNDYFATHSGWLGYSRKTKWELVIRDKNFLDLNIWYHCRHSFCFALSRIHKKRY